MDRVAVLLIAVVAGCAGTAEESGPRGARDVALFRGGACLLDEDGAAWCADDEARGRFTRVALSDGVQVAANDDTVCTIQRGSRAVACVARRGSSTMRWPGPVTELAIDGGHVAMSDGTDVTTFDVRTGMAALAPSPGTALVLGRLRVCARTAGTVRCRAPGLADEEFGVAPDAVIGGGDELCVATGAVVECRPLDGSAYSVELPEPAAEIATGPRVACARTGSGRVYCWDAEGCRADTAVGARIGADPAGCPGREPVLVSMDTGADRIAVGPSAACAILAGNALHCWAPGPAMTARVRIRGR